MGKVVNSTFPLRPVNEVGLESSFTISFSKYSAYSSWNIDLGVGIWSWESGI